MSLWPNTFTEKNIHRLIFSFFTVWELVEWIEDSGDDEDLQCAIVPLYPNNDETTIVPLIQRLVKCNNRKALHIMKKHVWVYKEADWKYYAETASPDTFAVVMQHETSTTSRELLRNMCHNYHVDLAKSIPFQTVERLLNVIDVEQERKMDIIEDACNANNVRLLHLLLNQLCWHGCFINTVPSFSKDIVWPIVKPHICSRRIVFQDIDDSTLEEINPFELTMLVSLGALKYSSLCQMDLKREFIYNFLIVKNIHVANFLWDPHFEQDVIDNISSHIPMLFEKEYKSFRAPQKNPMFLYDLVDQLTNETKHFDALFKSVCIREIERNLRNQPFENILKICRRGAKLGRCTLVRVMLQTFVDNEVYCTTLRHAIVDFLEWKKCKLSNEWLNFIWEIAPDLVANKVVQLARFAHLTYHYRLWEFLDKKCLVTDDVLYDIAFHCWNKTTPLAFAKRVHSQLKSWPLKLLKNLYHDMKSEHNMPIARYLCSLQPTIPPQKSVESDFSTSCDDNDSSSSCSDEME